MAKHTITGFITWQENPFSETPEVSFLTYDPTKYDKESRYPRVVVREHSFEVEVPDSFDPRPGQIAVLEEQKQKLRAAFAASVMEIDKRISELQAITFDAEAA